MNYISGYFITGLLITMFFEYIFEFIDVKGHNDAKFDSYWERLISLLLWPILIYYFVEQFFKIKKK